MAFLLVLGAPVAAELWDAPTAAQNSVNAAFPERCACQRPEFNALNRGNIAVKDNTTVAPVRSAAIGSSRGFRRACRGPVQ